eukprot:gene10118-biopygen6796
MARPFAVGRRIKVRGAGTPREHKCQSTIHHEEEGEFDEEEVLKMGIPPLDDVLRKVRQASGEGVMLRGCSRSGR